MRRLNFNQAVDLMRPGQYSYRRIAAAKLLGHHDGIDHTPKRSLSGWSSAEILAWLAAWRGRRAAEGTGAVSQYPPTHPEAIVCQNSPIAWS